MKRKRKRIWMTNVFTAQAGDTIARMERENPEWLGKIVQGDPEPTCLNRKKLIRENMVGIYRNE